jgi:AmiR/NasT family two-component response regulator
MKRVLVAVPDLLFSVPITNAVRAAGAEPIPVRHAEDAFAALASGSPHPPDAVVVDLTAHIDPADVIAAAAGQNIPVFAFGPHLNTAAIMAARAAGADKVVANAGMATALPPWLAYQLAHPAAEG